MRKRLITPTPQDAAHRDEGWLDLDGTAAVEVRSEDKGYPVESALVAGETQGWRAVDSGTQTIRLIFDQPQSPKRIALAFEETQTDRTKEFVLRWSPDGGRSFREIVCQQWNFSPPNTIRTAVAGSKWQNGCGRNSASLMSVSMTGSCLN